jgi:hypothetical protein
LQIFNPCEKIGVWAIFVVTFTPPDSKAAGFSPADVFGTICVNLRLMVGSAGRDDVAATYQLVSDSGMRHIPHGNVVFPRPYS